MRSSLLLLRLLVAIPTIHLTTAYKLGDNVPMCWRTDTTTSVREELTACPQGLDISFDEEVPTVMHERELYSTTYTLDASFLAPWGGPTSQSGYTVPHANIHSCPSKIGYCTPFIANNPNLATHTEALKYANVNSDGKYTFVTSDLTLAAEDYAYSIIAHGRVFNGTLKYDVACQITRTILPPTYLIVISPTAITIATVIMVATLIVLGILAGKRIFIFKELPYGE